MLRRKLLLLGGLLLMCVFAQAQSGKISGTISEKATGEGVPFANVVAFQNGVQKAGVATDFEGNFTISPLTPGTYDLKISAVGFGEKTLVGIEVSFQKTTRVNPESLQLQEEGIAIDEVEIYSTPLIDPDNTSTGMRMTGKEIERLPTRDINSAVSIGSSAISSDYGSGLNINGTRSSGTQYYLNGVKLPGGAPNVPTEAIAEMTVINGGVPAQYGDVTGGIVAITTKGPSSRFSGGIVAETSAPFHSDNYGLISAYATGPILTRKVLEGEGDDAVVRERPMLGYFANLQLTGVREPNRPATDVFVVREDVLKDLQNNPLSISQGLGGDVAYNQRSQNLRSSDFVRQDYRPNAEQYSGTLNASFDYQPSDNVIFTVGGTGTYAQGRSAGVTNRLLNSDNNPLSRGIEYNVFGRFTQNFRAATEDEDEEGEGPLIKNAYYQVQFDYTHSANNTSRPELGDDLFKYAHVGKFRRQEGNFLIPFLALYPDAGVPKTANRTGVTFNGQYYEFLNTGPPVTGSKNLLVKSPFSLYSFEKSEINPIVGNYTQPYFDENEGFVPSLNNFPQNVYVNGSGFGAQSNLLYGLYNHAGIPNTTYNISHFDQYRVSALGQAEIKNHALTLGFEFEQRRYAGYGVAPSSLWSTARGLANNSIIRTDSSTLVLSSSTADADIYEFQNSPGQTANSQFVRNLREKLGVGPDYVLNVDEVDPALMDISMFSAGELIQQIRNNINYYGYDYAGNRDNSNPAFSDFFTDTLRRPQGAFTPNYAAFFIEDKFEINDLIIRIGLRVDRYDANTQVLKDRYSLTGLRRVGETDLSLFNGGQYVKPDNIGDDYAIYVDRDASDYSGTASSQQSFNVLGFRSGNQWYDAAGNEVANGIPLRTGGGFAAPWFDISGQSEQARDIWEESSITLGNQGAFEDYTPQYNVMPRISFSFPISEDALFYAHYDVLTQRPEFGGSLATPLTYYLLSSTSDATVGNPNLRPQRTIDYQLGFQQRLTQSSSLKIGAFYKDFKDLVQQVLVIDAYPNTYKTWENIDYGTSKGITLDYELRRTKNLTITANYTLTFAEGTGSGITSNEGFLNANSTQPNLRIIVPLDFDNRHAFKLNLDYRVPNEEGPEVFGKRIFENVGFNFNGQAYSGSPFTRYRGTPPAIWGNLGRPQVAGRVNGSRLPYNVRFGAKIDKTFMIVNEVKGTQQAVNIYLRVTNLFNTRNVISVYRFTGSPQDDAFLTSAVGQNFLSEQVNPESYTDVYNTRMLNPYNYSQPRQIIVGLAYRF